MTEDQELIAKGWGHVDIGTGVLWTPPYNSCEAAFIKTPDGTKVEIKYKVMIEISNYWYRACASEDLDNFMENNEYEIASKEEIEENREDIIEQYLKMHQSSYGWYEDMEEAIKWTLGL